jgi:hypothetical protein
MRRYVVARPLWWLADDGLGNRRGWMIVEEDA